MPTPVSDPPPAGAAHAQFSRLVAEAFRRAGWRVQRPRSVADAPADLVVEAAGKKYLVEVKRTSEGRRDRLIPLLCQAIIQAHKYAQQCPEPAVPVAVVCATRVPPLVAEQVKEFAARYAPDVAIGIVDAEGFRAFAGHGLEVLDAQPLRASRPPLAAASRLPHLFSDLNQWMLKILLGHFIPEPLLSVPRAHFRNATQLAQAARVSIMSASRFLRQLAREVFLDEPAECLRLVRIDELMQRWVAANQPAVREVPVRWIIRKDLGQLLAAVETYAGALHAAARAKARPRGGRIIKTGPRVCIGLFAAADALGLGFVHGAPPHIYLERLDLDVLEQFGLTTGGTESRIDAYVRIPANREAVFRPVVLCSGLPVSDVVQVWLDVYTHPARGQEQAGQIRRRVLKPLFGKK